MATTDFWHGYADAEYDARYTGYRDDSEACSCDFPQSYRTGYAEGWRDHECENY